MLWLVLILGLIIMVVLDIPILFILGVFSAGYFFLIGMDLTIIPPTLVGSVDSFTLLAVPIFIFVGFIMNAGGITSRLFKFATNLVGHIPGGLGHVNVAASVIFAGMSGSSIADAAGLGAVEIKAMTDAGYDREFSAGITTASSLIGPIIPPSVPMVVFCGVSGASLGRLLLSGIIPGLMMAGALMLLVYWVSIKKKYPVCPAPTFKQFFQSLFDAIPALLTPIILLAGIISGMFTPTESALVAAAYAIIVSFFVYREMGLKDLLKVCTDTMVTTGAVLGLLAMASVFARIMALEGVAAKLLNMPEIANMSPIALLFSLNIILLFIGCFMQVTPSIILFGPILLPMVQQAGIDPVHFGLIMVLNLVVGTVTPPVAASLFAVASVANIPPMRVFKATLPFLVPILIVLLLVTYIPALSLFIPNMVFGK